MAFYETEFNLPRSLGKLEEDRFNLSESVTLDDGIGEQTAGEGVKVRRVHIAAHDVALAGRRVFHASEADDFRGADDLLGHRVGDAGAEGGFDDVGQVANLSYGWPPLGSLSDRVAEEFNRETMKVGSAQAAFDEV